MAIGGIRHADGTTNASERRPRPARPRLSGARKAGTARYPFRRDRGKGDAWQPGSGGDFRTASCCANGNPEDSRSQTPRTVHGGASASRGPRDRRSNRFVFSWCNGAACTRCVHPHFCRTVCACHDAGREMYDDAGGKALGFSSLPPAAGEPHRAGVVTGRCVLAAVLGCTPSVVAGSAPTEGVGPKGEIAGGGKTAGGGRGGGVFVLLLGVAFAGGCSTLPPPRGFIGAVTSGLSSFLSSSRLCKFASCVP